MDKNTIRIRLLNDYWMQLVGMTARIPARTDDEIISIIEKIEKELRANDIDPDDWV